MSPPARRRTASGALNSGSMKRFATCMVLGGLLALLLAACSDQTAQVDGPPYVSYGSCAQFTTCGACTPVSGCGWCSTGNGGGFCSSDPYSCDQGAATWNWNLQGCRAAADASVHSADAGGDAPAPIDAAPDGVTTLPPDGASSDAPTEGG